MSALIYRLHQTGKEVRDFADRALAFGEWLAAMTQVEDGERTSLYAIREDRDTEELLAYYKPTPRAQFSQD